MADDLTDILDVAKATLPGLPDEEWTRLELAIRQSHGATRVYIARRSKGQHLQALESAADDIDAERMAKLLGISPRRVRQLRELL